MNKPIRVTMYAARPKIGASVAYHAKGAVKRARYISPTGRPKPETGIPWYYNRYNRVGKIGQGYVVGLSKAERALIRQGALVYMLAPSRGQKRLYIIDCSITYRTLNAPGTIATKWGWRYFARKPFTEEVQRLVALGAKLDAKTWTGFTK